MMFSVGEGPAGPYGAVPKLVALSRRVGGGRFEGARGGGGTFDEVYRFWGGQGGLLGRRFPAIWAASLFFCSAVILNKGRKN